MVSMVWAFSSMFVLMLIISFLPIGFTSKGKIFVVITSFLLALGGLAAVPVLPLWETALMLILLILLLAYFMGNRSGAMLFKGNTVEKEVPSAEYTTPVRNIKIEKETTTVELTELNIDLPFVSDSNLQGQGAVLHVMEKTFNVESNILEEDISFLLERNRITVNDEQKTVEVTPEIGYLSEIESLLDGDLTVEKNYVNNHFLEKADDLLPLQEEDSEEMPILNELESLIDNASEMLYSNKEVAAAQDEKEVKKNLILQK